MKKTFEVNINGKIFHIDEDAYELLKNYLSQLREAFPGEEGEEIVSDIECRISEHFEQRDEAQPVAEVSLQVGQALAHTLEMLVAPPRECVLLDLLPRCVLR